MTIINIDEAAQYDGQEVTIRGWLYNIRESGKLVFPIFFFILPSMLLVAAGPGLLQVFKHLFPMMREFRG